MTFTLFVRRLSMLAAAICMCVPVAAVAEPLVANMAPAGLEITEILPGGTNASEEFIELYNPTTQVINFASATWQLQITSSVATTWSGPFRKVTLTGHLNPGEFYLVTSKYTVSGQPHVYLTDPAADHFSAGISASAGHVRLAYSPELTASPSSWQTVDEAEWSGATNGQTISPSWDNRTVLITQDVPLGASIKRHVSAAGLFADTNNDTQDFSVTACPTPAVANIPPEPLVMATTPIPVIPPDDDVFCEADHPAPPSDDVPAAPTQPTPLEPPTDSPPATIVDNGSDAASTAAAKKTTSPVFPAADLGLLAPQITELLPNPTSPQTDAADEFIELYNNNVVPFDLSGFALRVGVITTHTYVFPAGASLPAHGFKAFYSADTRLSLSNSGGQVRLLDPYGNVVAQTDQYGTAKDGQAWALAAGKWFWTTTPTANANNVISVPAASTKKKSTVTNAAAKKSTAKHITAEAKTSATTAAIAPDDPKVVPVQPGILAVAAIFALLYGAYEYRQDMANKFYQFRKYRAARAAARTSSEGG